MVPRSHQPLIPAGGGNLPTAAALQGGQLDRIFLPRRLKYR